MFDPFVSSASHWVTFSADSSKTTLSNATLFHGTPGANANALGEWSSESDKSGNKGSKCAGVQRCRVCVQLNKPISLERERERAKSCTVLTPLRPPPRRPLRDLVNWGYAVGGGAQCIHRPWHHMMEGKGSVVPIENSLQQHKSHRSGPASTNEKARQIVMLPDNYKMTQADCDTHRYQNKTLPCFAFGFFVLHSWAIPTVQLEALQMPFVVV